MFLKRTIALVTGLLLFIIGFIVYFDVVDAEIEGHFRKEREKYGVEGMAITTTITTPTIIASPSASAAPAPFVQPATPVSSDTSSPTPATPATTDASTSTTPAAIPDTSTTPSPSVPAAAPAIAPDTNVIIGPLPPPSSATPDTNAAPTAPSTLFLPGARHIALLALAGLVTNEAPTAQAPTQVPSPEPLSPGTTPLSAGSPLVIPSPTATNAPTSGQEAPATGTNSAPFALSTGDSGAPRPVPVEASVIVLGYHQFVAPGVASKNPYVMRQDVFEAEMKYLKDNGYHVVPLSDVVKFIKHEVGLPPNSVAITIDDGYKSAIVYAAPILKKYGYPWTYFVYPQFITPTEGKGAASWPDLLALQADGVDVESHSMTHPILTKKGGKSPEAYTKWLTNETAGSKAVLEQKLGKKILYLAYPYGAYNKEVEANAIAAGYDAVFTVADNPVHATTYRYSVGRYIITQPVEKSFAAFLRQGALSVANADPAPGSTTSNPRPLISAVLGYVGNLDPKSIETSVRDYGLVKHDFDPVTNTVRIYLPRNLIQPTNIVNIRVKDAESGQIMVANWHFNYEPAGAAPAHAPIPSTPESVPTTTTPAAETTPSKAVSAPVTTPTPVQ